MWAERIFLCLGCDRPIVKRAPASAQVRCIDCTIERSVMAIYQMRNKRGQFYDRWAAGMARAAAEAAARTQLNDVEDRRG